MGGAYFKYCSLEGLINKERVKYMSITIEKRLRNLCFSVVTITSKLVSYSRCKLLTWLERNERKGMERGSWRSAIIRGGRLIEGRLLFERVLGPCKRTYYRQSCTRRTWSKVSAVLERYPYYRGHEYDVTLKAPLTIKTLDDKWR